MKKILNKTEVEIIAEIDRLEKLHKEMREGGWVRDQCQGRIDGLKWVLNMR